MADIDDILKQGRMSVWRDYLLNLAKTHPSTWVESAFGAISKSHFDVDAPCATLFEVAKKTQWRHTPTRKSQSLLEAMQFDKWDLVPWILKSPLHLDLGNPELDYFILRGLDRGVWTHLDLIRPQAFLDERAVRGMAHDLFKHDQYTYYHPLRESVIEQLVQLPKHPDTAIILGEGFSRQQRDIECSTNLEMPGVLPSLVIMVKAGWLDLDAAKRIPSPHEASIFEAISIIERASLAETSLHARGLSGMRRI